MMCKHAYFGTSTAYNQNEMTDDIQIGFSIVRHILKPDEPPQTVHWVGFSRVGSEVLMDVGFIEMPQLVEQLAKAKEAAQEDVAAETLEMHVNVFQRFGLGLDTFVKLKTNVDIIFEAMVESGHIEQSDTES